MPTLTRQIVGASQSFIRVTAIGSVPVFVDVRMNHYKLFVRNDGTVPMEITFSQTTPAGTIWDTVNPGGSVSQTHSTLSGFWVRCPSGSVDIFVAIDDLRVYGGVE